VQSRLHRHIAAAVLTVSALAAAGCSSTMGQTTPPAPDVTQSPGSATSPAAAVFPATITAKNGSVTIAARPKKIVSLSPTATEDLFAVGAGAQVVAVDDQSNYPATAPKTALSGFKPDAEAIAKYTPDLVVVAEDSSKIAEQLTKLGVPVLWFDAAGSLDDAYAQITALGQATGHSDQAATQVSEMKAKIGAAVAAVKKPTTPLKYYYEVGNQPYYSSTSKTFIGSIFARFGLANVADAADKTGSGYPQLSDEYIVTAAPDLVFLADTKCCQQSATAVAARPGWTGVPAVKNSTAKGTVVALDDDIASRWGPRLVDLVQQISGAVTKAQG
jgi:iron complex transport system substrate-binding protein